MKADNDFQPSDEEEKKFVRKIASRARRSKRINYDENEDEGFIELKDDKGKVPKGPKGFSKK